MKLRDDEKRMLEGQEGPAVQKSMEFLVKIGDANGAEDMVDITSAHILSSELEDALYNLVSDYTQGVRVKVLTGTHPQPFNLDYLEAMKIPIAVADDAKKFIPRVLERHKRLGVIPTYACFPYFAHHLRLGDHIAWTETQVVPFANAWFGARTNLQSPLSAIASAVTGKTPNYGLHLPENRLGTGLIEIDPALEPEKFDYADYVALSFWAGKLLVDNVPVIPVYNGLSPKTGYSMVKHMCSHSTWNSGVVMFHVVGVTPEAPTVEAAFGGKRPEVVIPFSKKEMQNAYEELNSASDRKVDIVIAGCPHCTVRELADVAQLLDGKKVHPDTQLWVGTAEATETTAKRMGSIQAIKDAGGLVISGACISLKVFSVLQPSVVASASGLVAVGAGAYSGGKTRVWFGKLSDCINAAVKSKWEVN